MIGVFCSRKKPLPTDVRKVICIDTRGATSKLVLLETYTVIQYYRGGNGNLLGYYLKEIPDFGFLSSSFIQVMF